MSDLYNDLGVAKDATSEDIKKAHRRRVRKAHPDAGGTADEFRRVNDAYVVLADPVKRKRYDETGQADTPRDDAVAELCRLFVQAAVAASDDADIVRDVRDKLKGVLRTVKNERRVVEQDAETAAKLRKRAKRVKSKAEPSLLRMALENQADAADQQCRANTVLLDAVDAKTKRQLAILAEYEYEPLPQSPMTATWGGQTFPIFEFRTNT